MSKKYGSIEQAKMGTISRRMCWEWLNVIKVGFMEQGLDSIPGHASFIKDPGSSMVQYIQGQSYVAFDYCKGAKWLRDGRRFQGDVLFVPFLEDCPEEIPPRVRMVVAWDVTRITKNMELDPFKWFVGVQIMEMKFSVSRDVRNTIKELLDE